LAGSIDAGAGVAMVRPESVTVQPDPDGTAAVAAVAFLGPVSRVSCDLADGSSVTAQVSGAQAQQLPTGEQVRVSVEPVPVLVVPAD
jgi:putative spermidine/putrescine transport system ATP-binding protein